MLFMSVFVMLSRLFIAALWSPEGKGLTSWLYYDFVTFPFGILGQVWYLIVSIPGLRLYSGTQHNDSGQARTRHLKTSTLVLMMVFIMK